MVVSSVGLVIMIVGIWNLANLKLTYYTTFTSNFRFTAILLTFLQSNLSNTCKYWKGFDLHCIYDIIIFDKNVENITLPLILVTAEESNIKTPISTEETNKA